MHAMSRISWPSKFVQYLYTKKCEYLIDVDNKTSF